jgi:hypothetical protein
MHQNELAEASLDATAPSSERLEKKRRRKKVNPHIKMCWPSKSGRESSERLKKQ